MWSCKLVSVSMVSCSWQLVACSLEFESLASWCWLLPTPSCTHFTTQSGHYLNPGTPPAQPASAAILQYIPSTLPDHQNAAPGIQKATKMRSWAVPRTQKYRKNQKSATLRKHQYLLCFSYIWPSGSANISTARALKNKPFTTACNFNTRNHEKHKNV